MSDSSRIAQLEAELTFARAIARRQRGELERLRAALQHVADFMVPDGLASWSEAWDHMELIANTARAALAAQPAPTGDDHD
jgi:hypothetical protein